MCDVVYVLHLERIERETLAAQHTAAVYVAAGATDVVSPSVHEEWARFDALLIEDPAVESSTVRTLRELGVA